MGMTKKSKAPKQRQLKHGDQVIDYTLVYSNERTTLGIQVATDGRVLVRAPHSITIPLLESLLRERIDWINKHQARFMANPMLPARQYIAGETLLYLGSEYTLTITAGERERVRLDGDALIVTVCDPADTPRVKDLILRWYRQRANEVFNERLAACLPTLASIGVNVNGIHLTIRNMKTRWGTCSARRRVTLNLRLVQAAPELIDYVIVHELCHFKEMNHSQAFYALMDQALPEWRKRGQQMNHIPIL